MVAQKIRICNLKHKTMPYIMASLFITSVRDLQTSYTLVTKPDLRYRLGRYAV